MHQIATNHDYSSYKLHCKLKLIMMKVLSDLSLEKPSFLFIAYMKKKGKQTFCISSYGKEKDGQKSSGLLLC